ncbi:ATP-binding protein [Streptomyces sp. NPDC086787]|uniref:ATP-binding protein n=1 Tax=Streptomyces sp. NPDC086787 TaxID=3365759 RepID=UPI0037F2564B
MRADSVDRRRPPKRSAVNAQGGCVSCRREWRGVWLPARGERPALLSLDSCTSSIGEARRAAAQYAAVCVPSVDRGDVELLVSELCTNAHRHATGWWRLRVHSHEGELVLDVDDAATSLPRRRDPDLVHGRGGLGLLLVDRLATRCQFFPHSAGKTVRVVLGSGPVS